MPENRRNKANIQKFMQLVEALLAFERQLH